MATVSQHRLLPCVLPADGTIVIVGDRKQLGPVVMCREVEADLSVTLMDLLEDAGVPSNLLDTQYRMHEDIASYPSEYVYTMLLALILNIMGSADLGLLCIT